MNRLSFMKMHYENVLDTYRKILLRRYLNQSICGYTLVPAIIVVCVFFF